MKKMITPIIAGIKTLLVMTIICGGLYTLLVTGIGQLFFKEQANGSQLIRENQQGEQVLVGSHLIGQEFTESGYLHGRPQAEVGNLSPVSETQNELVKNRLAKLKAIDPAKQSKIPSDLVYASASGIDPEISLAAALYQVPRITSERNLREEDIQKNIEKHTTGQIFGKIGRARVNVLEVNLDLDKLTKN